MLLFKLNGAFLFCIMWYRGNTPFCSQECRQEQIGIDEARERRCKKASKKPKPEIKKSTNVQTGTTLLVA